MKRAAGILTLAALLAAAGAGGTVRGPMDLSARRAPAPPFPPEAGSAAPDSPNGVRFTAVDVFVDSGTEALAAYQFELKVTAGDVTLVGVEGGEHPAFRPPPYYDPVALAGQRIVIAAFDTGGDLPRGRTRVARLMVRVRGAAAPAYDASLVVAASPDENVIAANISVAEPARDGEPSDPEGVER